MGSVNVLRARQYITHATAVGTPFYLSSRFGSFDKCVLCRLLGNNVAPPPKSSTMSLPPPPRTRAEATACTPNVKNSAAERIARANRSTTILAPFRPTIIPLIVRKRAPTSPLVTTNPLTDTGSPPHSDENDHTTAKEFFRTTRALSYSRYFDFWYCVQLGMVVY